MSKPNFVNCVELPPALGEVDAFFVLQFVISKVDEGEVLEIETTVRGRRRGGGGEERRGGRERGGRGGGGEGVGVSSKENTDGEVEHRGI